MLQMEVLKTKALRLTAAERLELVNIELQRPGPDEIVVEVLACGICGSNLHGWRHPELSVGAALGHPGADGHEIAARRLDSGELVAVEPNRAAACGKCETCQRGAAWFCRNRRPISTWGFAERMVIAAAGAYPISAEPGAVTLVEPLACAIHALRHCHTSPVGRRVAVLGAGVMGLLAAAAVRHMGAREVVIIARYQHQATLAAEFGAHGVESTDARLRNFDLVVEAVGGIAPTFKQAVSAAAGGGEVIVLGLFNLAQPLDTRRAARKELRVFFPVTYARKDGRDDFHVALELIEDRAYPFERLLSHRFGLSAADEAFRTAADKNKGSLRVLMEPGR